MQSSSSQSPPLLSPLTPEDIGKLQIHLPALKIISYRGPGQTGGVVASLSPLTRQLGTKVYWVALSGVPSGQDAQTGGFSFHRPEIAAKLTSEHTRVVYDYLWPLLHSMPERAAFDPDAWRSFKQASQSIANEAQRIWSPSFPTLIWLHDFEMALVAQLVGMDAGAILAHFWHAPWPEPEIICDTPVARELVEALLHNRLIGFHTAEYANNFLRSVARVLPGADVNLQTGSVVYRDHTTRVVAMPLGVDVHYWQRLARTSRVAAEALPVRYRLAQQVVLGVDRLDYTKGILEKLSGVEHFLRQNPNYLRRFHYVQLAQKPETRTEAFEQYRKEVEERVASVNGQFGTDNWQPIVYLEDQLSHADLAAWYQAADVLAVTPVRDGLNLIAKEYVSCRADEQGALVLSRWAGAAAELASGALLVDPANGADIAQAIGQALSMPVEEKRRRMVSMRHVVSWNRLHDWACGFLRLAIDSNERPLMTA